MTTNFTQMNLLTTNHSNHEPKNNLANHSKVNSTTSNVKLSAKDTNKNGSSKIDFQIKENDNRVNASLDIRN